MTTATSTARPETAVIHTYNVDPSHSKAEFKVRHLGFSKVTGRFETFTASIKVDPADLGTLEVEATLDANSINTGEAKRDAHLRSGDFFDIEKYPQLTFKSTGAYDITDNTVSLPGELTIRGVTQPVVLDVEYMGQATDPWGGQRVAFEAKTRISRKDFGLTWNTVLESGGVLVADEIEIYLDVQAVQANG